MNLRSFLNLLDERGELLRVSREVDPKYELGALLEQAEARGKAILFEKVKGSDFPVVASVLLNRQRQALALKMDEHALDDRDAVPALLDSVWANPIDPVVVEDGPVHENVLMGEAIDLTALPVPLFFDGDSHPFITAGLGLAHDPDSGELNLGFYRSPIVDKHTLSVGASQISNLRRIYNKAIENGAKTMPVALTIGGPLTLYMTAATQVQPGIADLAVAGAMQKAPIELVKCVTNDLLVPAQAEFVIEAEVDLTRDVEHVMGEYGDNYGDNVSPVARVTAITYRNDALFQVINAGMTREHNNVAVWLFSHLRLQLQASLKQELPFVTDVHIHSYPPHGGARSRCAVAIAKTDDAQPQQVIDFVYNQTVGRFPLSLVLQRVVVVDADVDVEDEFDIEWAIGSRLADPVNLEVTAAGGIVREARGTRISIDATVPMDLQAQAKRPAIPDADRYKLDDYI